jgi:4-amino-4-deoxy-L-arabinose transferase-like glycosyltransferase
MNKEMSKFWLFWSSWRSTLGMLFLILIFALVLRIYNLGELPIFGDEAIYIRWAQIMQAEPGLRFVPLSDGKQPLFMWSVMPALKIFEDPLIAGRMISVITGLGTSVGVFVLTSLLFKKQKASMIATLLYTISPYSVFFDRMALADSMLAFFGVWALIFSILTVQKVRLDTAMLAGFFLGGALLTKSPSIFFALMIPITLLLYKWPKKYNQKFYQASVFVFLFSFTYAIGFGLANILRLGENFHMLAARNLDYVYPYNHILTSPLDPLISFLCQIIGYYLTLGTGLVLILIGLGVWFNCKKYTGQIILLLAWWLVPTLIMAEYAKVMTARYVLLSLPYAFALAGLSVINIKVGLKGVIYFGVLVFVLLALRYDFFQLTNIEAAPLLKSERSGYLEEWTAGGGIADIAQDIRVIYSEDPDKAYVVGTEGYFGTLPNGLQIYLNDLRAITIIGVGVDLYELPQSLIDSKNVGNNTYLVANSSRLLFDADEAGLKLISAYPKPFRSEGTKEYDLHGPRDTLYLYELVQ